MGTGDNAVGELDIVALAGQSGSGKSTITHDLAEAIQARTASFGAFVRAEAYRRGQPTDIRSLQALGAVLIQDHGLDGFVQLVLKTATGPGSVVILDGVRSVAAWSAVRAVARRSVLIYLDAPLRTRLARLRRRDGEAMEGGAAWRNHALEADVPELRAHAAVVLKGRFTREVRGQLLSAIKDAGIATGD